MIKARGFSNYFRGNLADFLADHRIWAAGTVLVVEDAKQIRYGDNANEFADLPPIYEQDMKPAQKVALLGATVNLTAVGAVFADLAAARTATDQLRSDAEARLDAIEAKLDALIGVLITAGEMSAT